MKHYFFLSVIMLFIHFAVIAQNYQSGYRSVIYNDPNRAGRTIATDLYYPAATSGTNVPIAAGNFSFPVVVFGHGFSLSASAYVKLADTLTRYGYIAAFPTTESGLAPSHDNFGKDLSFLCTAIIQSGSDPASFLYQRVSPRAAVGGHSMGGGCSFLAAASDNPNIYALFNMAAAETNPSAVTAASSVSVPTLIFSGSSDCIVPPSNQQNMYNNISNSCKSQVTITGATHCQITDNNFTCAFGQITSGCNNSSITVNTVYTKTAQLLIPFLDYTIKDICTRGVDYYNTLNSISGVSVATNCTNPNCSILPIRIRKFIGYSQNGMNILSMETENTSGISYNLIIEKSTDGYIFHDWINMVMPNGSFVLKRTLIDSSSEFSRSFYRIRLESDSYKQYSNILFIKPFSDLEVRTTNGNVVQNKLNLQMNGSHTFPIVVKVIGSDGRIYFVKRYSGFISGQIISLPLEFMPNGFFLAEICNDTGVLISRIKFIKVK